MASLVCLLAAALVLLRVLPAQNVAFIILCLAAVEAALEFWNHARNLPEGAMFWTGAIILLRTAGQILLKPWRQDRNYGLYLIGLASGGATGLQWLLDPAQSAAGRFLLTAICLTVLTPWFLQKRITASGGSKESGLARR